MVARAEHAFNAYLGTQRISNLWIYPTNEANTVFVHYEADLQVAALDVAHKQSHLVMLEMRGDQIARVISFSPSAPL